jgi:hypothetical protein
VHVGHGRWVDMRNRGAVFNLGFTSSVDRASEGSGAKVESGSGHLVITSKSYKQYATVAIELGEEDKSRHDHTSSGSPGSLGAVLKDRNVALGVLCQYIVHCLVALGMSLINTRQVVNVLNVRFSGSP